MAIGFGVVTATLFSAISLPAINAISRCGNSAGAAMSAACCLAACLYLCLCDWCRAVVSTDGAGRGCLSNAMAGRTADAAQPRTAGRILSQTRTALNNIADDVIVISAAMMVAFLVNSYNNINEIMQAIIECCRAGSR